MRTTQAFSTALVSMARTDSPEVSHDILKHATERYITACQSGEETALQQAMSSFAYASLKNGLAIMGGPLTPTIISRLAERFAEMSDWSFITILHEGPTAALLYSPSDEKVDEQNDADRSESALILLKFVNEDGGWKYEHTLIGRKSDIPSVRDFINGTIRPTPLLLPVAETVGLLQVKSYGYRTEVSITNVTQRTREERSSRVFSLEGNKLVKTRSRWSFVKQRAEKTSRTPMFGEVR